MQVIMIGGPYDGQVKDAPEIDSKDGYPVPIPYFELHPQIEWSANYIDSGKSMNTKIDILLYKCEEVWENGRFKRYEYHYQGR